MKWLEDNLNMGEYKLTPTDLIHKGKNRELAQSGSAFKRTLLFLSTNKILCI
jgi:hypothetical protein